MSRYVLDASAVLRYLENGPGAITVEQLIHDANNSACEIAISAVNWGEVLYVLRRKLGLPHAMSVAKSLRSLPVSITQAGEAEAESAADFKDRYSIAYADCFAAALADATAATLVTADFDFKRCESALEIEFLPRATAAN